MVSFWCSVWGTYPVNSYTILDNLKHWQIFEDDEHLKSFLQVIDDFSFLQIDEDRTEINENADGNDTLDFKNQIADHDIIQLSNNLFQKDSFL